MINHIKAESYILPHFPSSKSDLQKRNQIVFFRKLKSQIVRVEKIKKDQHKIRLICKFYTRSVCLTVPLADDRRHSFLQISQANTVDSWLIEKHETILTSITTDAKLRSEKREWEIPSFLVKIRKSKSFFSTWVHFYNKHTRKAKRKKYVNKKKEIWINI